MFYDDRSSLPPLESQIDGGYPAPSSYEMPRPPGQWRRRALGCAVATLMFLGAGTVLARFDDSPEPSAQLADPPVTTEYTPPHQSEPTTSVPHAPETTLPTLKPAIPPPTTTPPPPAPLPPLVVPDGPKSLQTIKPAPLFSFLKGRAGVDISYPNCKAVQPNGMDFVIVGVNGGRPTRFNPCLKEELGWAAQTNNPDQIGFYVNSDNPDIKKISFPNFPLDPNTSPECVGRPVRYCTDFNYGYTVGKAAVEYVRQFGLKSTFWGIDVELIAKDPLAWSEDRLLNRRAIHGVITAVTELASEDAGQPVVPLLYANRSSWLRITDNWQLPDYPVWLPGGRPSIPETIALCGIRTFTGGTVRVAQITAQPPGFAQPLDINFPCDQNQTSP